MGAGQRQCLKLVNMIIPHFPHVSFKITVWWRLLNRFESFAQGIRCGSEAPGCINDKSLKLHVFHQYEIRLDVSLKNAVVVAKDHLGCIGEEHPGRREKGTEPKALQYIN